MSTRSLLPNYGSRDLYGPGLVDHKVNTGDIPAVKSCACGISYYGPG